MACSALEVVCLLLINWPFCREHIWPIKLQHTLIGLLWDSSTMIGYSFPRNAAYLTSSYSSSYFLEKLLHWQQARSSSLTFILIFSVCVDCPESTNFFNLSGETQIRIVLNIEALLLSLSRFFLNSDLSPLSWHGGGGCSLLFWANWWWWWVDLGYKMFSLPAQQQMLWNWLCIWTEKADFGISVDNDLPKVLCIARV